MQEFYLTHFEVFDRLFSFPTERVDDGEETDADRGQTEGVSPQPDPDPAGTRGEPGEEEKGEGDDGGRGGREQSPPFWFRITPSTLEHLAVNKDYEPGVEVVGTACLFVCLFVSVIRHHLCVCFLQVLICISG